MDFVPVNYIRTTCEPMNYLYTINLDREITDVSDFQEELLVLRHAKQGDVVHIYLSSVGGLAETMKVFLSAMEQSEAHIITEVTGDIASAATFIFLAGHEYRISDNAELMFHNAMYGAVGKASDVKRQVDFAHKVNERLMMKYYKYFFTEEELVDLLNGKEFWLNAEETMQRLQQREEGFKEEESAELTPEEAASYIPMVADQIKDIAGTLGLEPTKLLQHVRDLLQEVEPPQVIVHAKSIVEHVEHSGACNVINSDQCTLTIYADGSVQEQIDDQIFSFTDVDAYIVDIQNPDVGRDYIIDLLKALHVTFQHNTGLKKLLEKLSDALKNVVVDLNA